jgi:hypothetical protein
MQQQQPAMQQWLHAAERYSEFMQEAMHPQEPPRKPTSHDALARLGVTTADADFLRKHGGGDGVQCAMCQDQVREGQRVVTLPCEDPSGRPTPHHFHYVEEDVGDGDTCVGCGVMEWLKDNNSCPCCRFELPAAKEQPVPKRVRTAPVGGLHAHDRRHGHGIGNSHGHGHGHDLNTARAAIATGLDGSQVHGFLLPGGHFVPIEGLRHVSA